MNYKPSNTLLFSGIKNSVLIISFCGFGIIAVAQEKSYDPTPVRTARRRIDVEEEKVEQVKKEMKDTMRLSFAKQKKIDGDKRKAKALYPGRTLAVIDEDGDLSGMLRNKENAADR